jgi:hypothetical protein
VSNDEDEVPYYLQLSKEQQEELSRELYRYWYVKNTIHIVF